MKLIAPFLCDFWKRKSVDIVFFPLFNAWEILKNRSYEPPFNACDIRVSVRQSRSVYFTLLSGRIISVE